MRLEKVLEDIIHATQCGFKEQSTTQAICIARMISSTCYRAGKRLPLVFQDWSQAFDTILHNKLLDELIRLDMDEHLIRLIVNLYKQPLFFVEDSKGSSKLQEQRGGIRQGRPLSHDLFILVMHVLHEDIKNYARADLTKSPKGLDSQELMYADDTLIAATPATAAARHIRLIKEYVLQY